MNVFCDGARRQAIHSKVGIYDGDDWGVGPSPSDFGNRPSRHIDSVLEKSRKVTFTLQSISETVWWLKKKL